MASGTETGATSGQVRHWLVLADDLTGAADCAIAFGRRGRRAAVTWGAQTGSEQPDVLAYDADTRGLPADAAAQAQVQALGRLLGPERALFKKIDSTLRGQPAAETAATIAFLRARRGACFGILAPAFPATGRTTLDGRVRVAGRPLEEAEVWRRDHTYPSADLAAILASVGIDAEPIGLGAVRGADLASALAGSRARGATVAICDAETVADLDRIARASLTLPGRPFYIGSAGLAHALAAAEDHAPGEPPRIAPCSRGTLIVVGSLAEVSRSAARALARAERVAHLPVAPDTLLGDAAGRADLAARAAAVLETGGDALVEIALDTAGGSLDMSIGPRLVRALAEALEPAAPAIGALAATGGETAAALLARFGVGGIRLVDEIEPGVSLGLTLGRLSIPVATKAGAFGDADSLIRITERLRAVRTEGRFA
jgi:D-threonate/D-erythronate kinase